MKDGAGTWEGIPNMAPAIHIRRQICCRHEPAYPVDGMVLFVGDSDLVLHLPRNCKIEAPHEISQCAEFDMEARP